MTAVRTSLAALALLASADALACGGFFCSNQPIDQSKERIIFAVDSREGTVETHVQIFYQGAAEEFSWVLPVPGVPELGLSTDALFQYLDWRTAPSFSLEWRELGTCEYDSWWGPSGGFAEDAAGGGPPQAADDGDEVTVVSQGQVGPYDQVTLQAGSAEALTTWLLDNGYILPEGIGEQLAPYVQEGSSFVALKLQKDKEAGDIAPIRFTYEASAASIPLILTSIAATPDMRLQPYVFSDGRFVPDNYLHVKITEAAIDWLNFGSNYDEVVTLAANEAGGQAFATDFAGSTASLKGFLYSDGQYDLDLLAQTDDPADFVMLMLNMGFPRSPQVLQLIRSFIPMPQTLVEQGVQESDFYNCLECYADDLAGVDFDPEAFAAALDEVVVQPLIDAEGLFSRFGYLTRMTSSMSPEEMTVDPMFVPNADMSDVSREHRATYIIDCSEEPLYSKAPRWIELSDGTVLLQPPGAWYEQNGTSTYDSESLDEVGAEVVEDAAGAGQPVLIADRSAIIADAVDRHNAAVRDLYDDLGLQAPDVIADPAKSCGCAATPAPAHGAALLGLLALARRRRR